MIALILLVFAFVCFFLAAIGVSTNKYNLIAAGLCFLTAYFLFGSFTGRP